MNEHSNFNGMPRGGSMAMGVLFGAVVGAGIALLLAPGSGKETRQRIADASRRWRGAARNRLHQLKETADDFKHDAKSALDAGREAYEYSRKSRESSPMSRELNG